MAQSVVKAAILVVVCCCCCCLGLMLMIHGGSSASSSLLLDNTHNKYTNNNKHDENDLVIIAYSSSVPEETLLWKSATHSTTTSNNDIDVKMIFVGQGMDLFQDENNDKDETTTTTTTQRRGWMFRFQTIVDGIVQEYEERNQMDFIVLVGDAYDTYIMDGEDTLQRVKERFLSDFGNYSIVFSSQIYCCNPWNLRDVGRAGWDEYYNSTIDGGPDTLYKHLNAGLFIGKASAIIEMAHEMQLWGTHWKQPEEFDDILQNQDGPSQLHMFDVDVDDDEWQLSVWYLKEQQQNNLRPRATLDTQQELFTTTGTFRASHRNGGFLIFSQDDFYGVVGRLPADYDKEDGDDTNDLDHVVQCPYTYDVISQTWTNTITNSHPLLFHFAGNDWLCACQILEATTHINDNDNDVVTKKFAQNCANEYPYWQSRVNEAIHNVSILSNSKQQLFLTRETEENDHAAIVVVEQRELLSTYGAPPVAAPVTPPIPAPVAPPVMPPTNTSVKPPFRLLAWLLRRIFGGRKK